MDAIERVHGGMSRLKTALGRALIGQEEVVDSLVAVALANGHALLEGVPGLGKTWLAQNFARAAGLEYRRIQFTPDLMPGDVTGTQMIETTGGELRYRFSPGPVFANLLLADEINRATPRTQSALLEAMQERAVTAAGETHELPRPFMVVATQNPLEMEGTYPLPEAQLDRFLARVEVTRPTPATLRKVLDAGVIPMSPKILGENDLRDFQEVAQAVPVSGPVLDFVTNLVEATHRHKSVRYGVSPRGAQGLVALAKAFALLDARPFVTTADVTHAIPLVGAHRLILTFEAELEGQKPLEILSEITAGVKP
ncbi:MAG TPA: AAA family ATPase [Deinococcales bacterium]|nr:AAA family ATPase [Deinococcales bacterium]